MSGIGGRRRNGLPELVIPAPSPKHSGWQKESPDPEYLCDWESSSGNPGLPSTSRRPRRTGLGALHHPAPRESHPRKRGQTHQRGIPSRRVGFRLLCETNQFRGHAQSPLSVGACLPGSLSPPDTPWLHQHYPASSLLWVSPTPHRLWPRSRGLDLSEAAHQRAPMMGSPWLPRSRAVRLDPALRSRVGMPNLPKRAGHTVACWRLETIGPFPHGHFGTLHLHGRHYPFPLHLACFRAYASRSRLPVPLQGSIPGPGLAVTRAGVPPARLRDIAKPQPRPDPTSTR